MTDSRKQAAASASMQTENIQVVLRARPLSDKELDRGYSIVDFQSRGRQKVVIVNDKVRNTSKTFSFDRVYGYDAKQQDVYDSVVKPLLEEVLNGYNCTIFAYGQTGSGKTYTMLGERRGGPLYSWATDPHAGIIPRTLSDLFSQLAQREAEYWVKVTFVELYNEELFDLLANNVEESKNSIKLFAEKDEKQVTIKGLQEVGVKNEDEVFATLERGAQRRTTAATNMNEKSSRSHTVFTINLQIKEVDPDGREVLKSSKLNLVDLAGSENVGRSGATGKRLVEAGTINQSLLTLGRVISALVDRQPHVPYRESKLTRILADSLGGRTKTCVIATISPDVSNLEETLSTLDYAHRAKNIQNKPEVNQTVSSGAVIKELAEDCDRLRRELDATRRKNGVFVDPNDYEAQVRRLKAQEESIRTLREALDAKRHECEEFSDRFTESQRELENLRVEFERIRVELDSETRLFVRACDKLSAKRSEARSQRFLLDKHIDAENQLYDDSLLVLNAANRAASHCDALQDKVARARVIDSENLANAQALVTAVRERENSLTEKLSEHVRQVIAKRDELITFVNESRAELRETISNALPTCAKLETDCNANVTRLRSTFDAFEAKHSNVLRGQLAADWESFRNEQFTVVDDVTNRVSNAVTLLDDLLQRSTESVSCVERKLAVGLTEAELDLASVSSIVRNHFEKADGQSTAFVAEYERVVEYYDAKLRELVNSQVLRERNVLSQARRLVEAMRTENEAALTKVSDDCRVKLAQLRQHYETYICSIKQRNAESDTYADSFAQRLKQRIAEQNDALVTDANDGVRRAEMLQGDVRAVVTDSRSMSNSINNELDAFKEALGFGVNNTKEIAQQFVTDIDSRNNDLTARITERLARLRSELRVIESALNDGSAQQSNSLRTLVDHVEQDAVSLRDEIGALRELIEMYVDGGVHADKSTGATPRRETYAYPRALMRCRTDDELVNEAEYEAFLRNNVSFDSFLDGVLNKQLEAEDAVDGDEDSAQRQQPLAAEVANPSSGDATEELKMSKLPSRIPKLAPVATKEF